jgi:uncharacterized protein
MTAQIVVLDTNILLTPEICKINMDAELKPLLGTYRLCITEGTKRELEEIASTNSRTGQAARIALKLIGHKNIEIIHSEKNHADDQIVEFAEKNDCIVATQDKLLKERIKIIGRKIIIVRSKTHFEIM